MKNKLKKITKYNPLSIIKITNAEITRYFITLIALLIISFCYLYIVYNSYLIPIILSIVFTVIMNTYIYLLHYQFRRRKYLRQQINAYMNMISMFLSKDSGFSYLNALGKVIPSFEGEFQELLKTVYNNLRATGNIDKIEILSDTYNDFISLKMYNDHIKIYERTGGNEHSFYDLTAMNNFELAQIDKLIKAKKLALINTYQLLAFVIGGILFFRYSLTNYYHHFINNQIGIIVTTITLILTFMIYLRSEKIYIDDKIFKL